ncbi:MAG: DUF1566 domain-containing protein [Gammaproteobacteria bacterium]|nr:DUF1566 domain-containing protein [Gammaproteobacteria bacterium]
MAKQFGHIISGLIVALFFSACFHEPKSSDGPIRVGLSHDASASAINSSRAAFTLLKEGQRVSITIALNKPAEAATQIQWQYVLSSATVDVDFKLTHSDGTTPITENETIDFAIGEQTQTLLLSLIDDAEIGESDEDLEIHLTPSDVLPSAQNILRIAIRDNDYTTHLNDSSVFNCAEDALDFCDASDSTGLAYQDSKYGRDALAVQARLQKSGRGPASFDFSRINANGLSIAIIDPKSNTEIWNCVSDNHTGLTWERLVKHFETDEPVDNSTYTWSEIQAHINELNQKRLCGFSDWRMPTLSEWMSLYFQSTTDSLNGLSRYFFPNADANTSFWYADSGDYKQTNNENSDRGIIDFSGNDPDHSRVDGATTNGLRLVRGHSFSAVDALSSNCSSSALISDSRYSVDTSTGEITDLHTQLVWRKCPLGLSDASCSTGSATTGLATISTELASSYTEWRLPNIKELVTLIDASCASDQIINTSIFTNIAGKNLMSATPDKTNTKILAINGSSRSIVSIADNDANAFFFIVKQEPIETLTHVENARYSASNDCGGSACQTCMDCHVDDRSVSSDAWYQQKHNEDTTQCSHCHSVSSWYPARTISQSIIDSLITPTP